MADKANLKLTDDLIRKAIELDLESVKAPSHDHSWHKIENALSADPRLAKHNVRFKFSPYLAAAIAAALLLFIGGLNLYQQLTVQDYVADTGPLPEAADEFGSMRTEDNGDISVAMDSDQPEAAEQPSDLQQWGVVDLEPPAWPATLPPELIIYRAVVFGEPGQQQSQGAFYQSSDLELLIIKTSSSEGDLTNYLELQSSYLNMRLLAIEPYQDSWFVQLDHFNGLAWTGSDYHYLALPLSGQFEPEQLVLLRDILN